MGISVYKTREAAERHLGNAIADLSHGGKQEAHVEHHALGWVISESKFMSNEGRYVFQRYYDERR